MATRYAVLLRGVNVGGRAALPMAPLRAALSRAGFDGVATLLASGNVALTSSLPAGAVGERVAAVVHDDFGLQAPCVVRSAEELASVLSSNPLAEVAVDGSRMQILFLHRLPSEATLRDADLPGLDPERVVVRGREVFQWCPEGISRAPMLLPAIERRLGTSATARNWNTVEKLSALLQT